MHANAQEVVRLINENQREAAGQRLESFEKARREMFTLLDEVYRQAYE